MKIYKHFKGNLYTLIIESIDQETGEELVTYACCETLKVYTRKKSEFHENIERPEYNYKGPRFELIL